MRPTPAADPVGRSRAVGAWLLFATTVALLVGALVGAESLEGRAPTETAGFDGWSGTLWVASWVGFPLVGAIIASRRRTVLGWLLLATGAGIATAVAFGLAPFAFDRDEVDLATVAHELVATSAGSLRPRSVSLWTVTPRDGGNASGTLQAYNG